jgi:histidine kinase
MKRFLSSLLFRLMVSHLLVVVVGVVVTALMSRSLAGSFFEGHLEDMGHDASMMGGGMSDEVFGSLREGFADSFERALTIAVIVSGVTALAASAFAATRVLRPLETVRKATRRLADGSYSERVPVPAEIELAALAHDVNALAEALEQVEERRVRLISEVAHELRSPLTTIQGYMEGLLDGVFEPNEEVFATSAREAARLQKVVADLSTLSQADEGAFQLKMTGADLGVIASEAVERLRPQFEGESIELRVEIGETLPVVGDSDRLTQVFTNIAGNALAYAGQGGHVWVRGERRGAFARVSISDDGIGIDPERLDLVFERFYRVDRDQRGGTGIGLTIARRFARLHGGDVTASSDGLDGGATFTVEIPLGGAARE